jgi:hypothetical protein
MGVKDILIINKKTMSILDDVTKIVSEKDKGNAEKTERDMEILKDRGGKIGRLEEKLGEFTHACKDFHEVENSLGVSLKEVKGDVVEEVKRALSM